MKAVISHDIDHITVFEHLLKDMILPKFLTRMHIELFRGKITAREYLLRWADVFKNKWQNIDELITFNNVNKVPSSFFIAVNKGVGLNYSNTAALLWIDQIKSRKCEIGVHGVGLKNRESLSDEYNLFKSLSGHESFGIRIHGAQTVVDTFNSLEKAGYRYDSSEHAFKDPYKIGGMWEFPFQVKDGWIIENGRSWQSRNLEESKQKTMNIIDEARRHNLTYLGIDFHDRYFSHSFYTWLEWYIWLVDYLKTRGIECVNFETAIRELEAKSNSL